MDSQEEWSGYICSGWTRRKSKNQRAKKLKMTGNEISMPCTSTTQMVKEKWAADVEDSTYSIGIRLCSKRGDSAHMQR